MQPFINSHVRIKQIELLQPLTVYLRYLLSCAFIMAAFTIGKMKQFIDL